MIVLCSGRNGWEQMPHNKIWCIAYLWYCTNALLPSVQMKLWNQSGNLVKDIHLYFICFSNIKRQIACRDLLGAHYTQSQLKYFKCEGDALHQAAKPHINKRISSGSGGLAFSASIHHINVTRQKQPIYIADSTAEAKLCKLKCVCTLLHACAHGWVCWGRAWEEEMWKAK